MRKQLPMACSALLLTGVNLLLRLVSTGFQVYLSRRLGAGGIGLLQLTQSVGGLASIAAMAGIRTAAMYLTAEELGKGRSGNIKWVLSGCLCYSILFSGGVALALRGFAPKIAAEWIGDQRTEPALSLLAAILPAACLTGVMTGYFTAQGRIAALAAVECVEQPVSMGVTVAALHFWAGSDPGRSCLCVFLGTGAGTLLTLGSLLFLHGRNLPAAGPRIPMGPRIRKTALPLGVADLVKAGISTGENLLVPKRLALCRCISDPLASYGLVNGMVFPVLMFPAAILFGLAELLIPELARCRAGGKTHRIQYLARKSLGVSLLYGLFFSGVMILTAMPLGKRLYDSPEAGQALRLYAALIPMLYCDAIVDAMTKGLGQQTACVRYNILTNGLDVVLLFILLPKFGMRGYFLSFFLTHFLNFCLSLRRLVKIAELPLSFRRPGRALVITALSVVGAFLLPQPGSRLLAFTGLWGSLLVLANVVSRTDLLWLKGVLTLKK